MKFFVIIFVILSPFFVFSQGKIIAHRGASSIAPENTISALNKAIESGCDYVEIDIRMSADDSIMVIHDETLDRTTNGTGRVDQYSYEELKGYSAGYANTFDADFEFEKIPSLYEMLSTAKGKIDVCIDLKNVSINPVIDQLEKMNMEKEVHLMSYNLDKLIAIKKTNSLIKTILLKNTITGIDLSLVRENEITGVSGSYLFGNHLVDKAHESGLLFWVGIVNDPAKAESLLNRDIDAVLTDYPQLMNFQNEPNITVSPNPFHESVEIQLTDTKDVQQILILDNSGSVVYEYENLSESTLTWRPDNNPSAGFYYIYMIKGETIFIEKMVYVD